MISPQLQTIGLYNKSGWKRLFSHIRFWDAPLTQVEKLIPTKGVVTELGSGDGIFSNYLALSSPERKVIGIEIDPKRYKESNKGLKNTHYILGDIRKKKLLKSDAIIIFHVLHHLNSLDEQEEILKVCKKNLNKKGKLFLIEIHVAPSFKYLLGWFFDHFLVPIFFEKRIYSKIYYRKQKDWEGLLKKLEFKTRTISLSRGKPISNIAIIAEHE